jgi:hypothetical protein
MRPIRLVLAATIAIMFCISAPLFAQGWIDYESQADFFGVNFPGEPNIEETTWASEYGAAMPARVYSVETGQSRYSATVVDFTRAEAIHAERVRNCALTSDCRDGGGNPSNSGLGYWRMDVQGSMVYAAWQYFQRDGEVTYYFLNVMNMVEGVQLQMTNADQSRTNVAIYLHEARLYILEATVPPRAPEPGLFQQSLRFIDEDGSNVRYRVFYHNSVWSEPPPPRTGGDPQTPADMLVPQP